VIGAIVNPGDGNFNPSLEGGPFTFDVQGILGQFCVCVLKEAIRISGSRSGQLLVIENTDEPEQHQYIIKSDQVHYNVLQIALEKLRENLTNPSSRLVDNFHPLKRRLEIFKIWETGPAFAISLQGRRWFYTNSQLAELDHFVEGQKNDLVSLMDLARQQKHHRKTTFGESKIQDISPSSLRSGNLLVQWSLYMGQELKLNVTQMGYLGRGALLHDIGELMIPHEVLEKPGPLNPDEWEMVRSHPVKGAGLVENIKFLQPSRDIILSHHERWDGKGYPQGLRSEQIPFLARIFSVVDVYNALLCDRPYSPAWPRKLAAAYIRQQAGLQFDPTIVEVFLKISDQMRTN
jgi:hypothetical protein